MVRPAMPAPTTQTSARTLERSGVSFAGATRGGPHVERRIDFDLAYFFESRGAVDFDDLTRFNTYSLSHYILQRI